MRSVIVSFARTPIGKLSGAFADVSAVDLGAHAISGALARGGIDGAQVDAVIMGQVLQAGTGQITARQAAARAGIPLTVPALTVNKVCLSGLNAIMHADLLIRSGEAEIVVAGGMESMTNAPYLLPGARAGYRLGDQRVVDSMIHDGLWCAFDDLHMGATTERDVEAAGGVDRAAQDAFAARSHARAAAAIADGKFADEIVPLEVRRRKDAVLVQDDEGVRADTTESTLSTLRPAFTSSGTITAGNASQISDGAAALVVVAASTAAALGLEPLAEIVGFGMVAGPDTSLLTQPSHAIRRALKRADVTLEDLSLIEINEAFAAVALCSMRDLGVDEDRVNVNGGAIALGHPIGMSGARVAMTLVAELRRRGQELGAAALCGGGGQGDAVILRAC